MQTARSGRPRLGVLPGFLVLLTPLSQLGFIPVSVVLGEQSGWSIAQVGVAVGIYAAAAGVGTIVLGPVFDLVSPRRVLPFAVAANVLLSASLLLDLGFWGVVVARVLTGLTNSALILCAAVLVADANRADPTARERGFSRLQTFNSVGAASGLAVGALAAGLGRPEVWSWVVVGYGVYVLALAPVIARRMAPTPRDVRPGLRELGRDVRAAVRAPRTVLLLLAAAAVAWAIQAAHSTVSLLSQETSPGLVARILLAVMIPAGVFVGSSCNQLFLARAGAATVFARTYPALPVACLAITVAYAVGVPAVEVVALLLFGAVTGVLMPLSPAVIVGWHPDLRSSVSAAEGVAKSVGATLSPVVLGVTATAWSMEAALVLVVVVALVGTVAAAVPARSAVPSRE